MLNRLSMRRLGRPATLTRILDAADELEPGCWTSSAAPPRSLETLHAITGADAGGLGQDNERSCGTPIRRRGRGSRVKVPPDVHARWTAVPGADDGDRVMATLRAWKAQDENVNGPRAAV